VLGSSFADDGTSKVDPNVPANDESNVAANDETSVPTNNETSIAANDESSVPANDESSVAPNDESNLAGNDESNDESNVAVSDEHNPRYRRQRAVAGRGLEMQGPGKETLHGRDGEAFDQEDGGEERGTSGLGRNQRLAFGFPRRDFVVQAE
jgi:hypothetical protein